MPRPTLLLLPGSGTSTRSWDGVVAAIGDTMECVLLDLPGLGGTAGPPAFPVEETAVGVAAQLRDREPDTWLIAGHGLGGTIAAVVAAWAELGEHGLIPAAGVVLVADEGGEPAGWSAAVDLLRTPTAVVADDASALLPPAVADRITALWREVRDRPALPAAFARLIASDRVSARTRRVMLARLEEPGGDRPRALTAAQRELLTAVLARVLPQRGTALDLAGRIDVALAAGQGDGWRFAELPPDAEAWRRGLDTVAALEPRFAALDATAQDAAIDGFAAGERGADDPELLTGEQLALWCTDLQAEAVRTWLAHPAAQARIRYDGFADGGDGPAKQGFTTTHAGEWEPWQRDWRTGEELRE